MDGKPIGALRVSLSWMNTFDDADYFLQFLRVYFIDPYAHNIATTPAPVLSGHVTEIVCYPIKSCHGYSVPKWKLTPRGLQYDRVFGILNLEKGRLLGQKQNRNLIQIQTRVDAVREQMFVTLGAEELVIDLASAETCVDTTTDAKFCGQWYDFF